MQLELYYITLSDQLSTKVYVDGQWRPGEDLSNYTAAWDTQHISLTSTTNTNSTEGLLADETTNQSLLIFENSSGNLTVLLKLMRSCSGNCTDSSWLDISKNDESIPPSVFSPVYYTYTEQNDDYTVSSTLYESSPGIVFGAPFGSGPSYQADDSGLNFRVQLLICSENIHATGNRGYASPPSCSDVMNVEYTSWTNTSHGYFHTSTYLNNVHPIIRN